MITNKGKELISRYLAGRSSAWAGAIELGVGTTAAAATDTSLEFPFIRVPVDYMDYDAVNYTVTVRAVLPDNVAGEFHEVGVFSSDDFPEGEAGNEIILDFTGEDTVYTGTNQSVVSANARVGTLATQLTAGVGGSADVRGFITLNNLDVYTGNDVFNLAYFYNNTGGTPTVNVRFESTTTDYFLHSFSPAAGYNIESFTKQSLSQTGTPSWDTVTSIYIETTDQSEVTLDGLIIEDTIKINDYGMIARSVLSPEVVKSLGIETDLTFEITLGF